MDDAMLSGQQTSPAIKAQFGTRGINRYVLSENGQAYALLGPGPGGVAVDVDSPEFQDLLVRASLDSKERVPTAREIEQQQQAARCRVIGTAKTEVHTRYAEHRGAIYLDLGGEGGEFVEIDQQGWRDLSTPPVIFRRPSTARALPKPVEGGDIAEFREYFGLPQEQLDLLLMWATAALRSRVASPILFLTGEPGAGKSVVARSLKNLLDPSAGSGGSLPPSERELIIAANNEGIMYFDNITKISSDQSDQLCRAVTGGGLRARRLYTDSSVVAFDVLRPLVLTMLEVPSVRGDLIDRSIILELERIPDVARQLESRLRDRFESARPRLLGTLLSLLSKALQTEPSSTAGQAHRMSDFAAHCTQVASALGRDEGYAARLLSANGRGCIQDSIENSAVAMATYRLIERDGRWTGTALDLGRRLREVAPQIFRERIPASPARISQELRAAAPGLRLLGCEVAFSRKNHARSITLGTSAEYQSLTSTAGSLRGAAVSVGAVGPVAAGPIEGLRSKIAKSRHRADETPTRKVTPPGGTVTPVTGVTADS